MNPAIWGLLSAAGWGATDFIVRFTGRSVGHLNALLGTFLVGVVALTVVVLAVGPVALPAASDLWLIGLAGATTMISTLLLYLGLVRGPIAVVAPIVSTFPAFNVAFSLAIGVRPSLFQWAAMGAVMAGTAALALSSTEEEGADAPKKKLTAASGPGIGETYDRTHVRRTAAIALAAAVLSAITVAAGQTAAENTGELTTVWLARLVSLTLLGLLLLVKREAPRLPVALWPLILAQGILDSGAYLALLAGSHGEGKAIAVVVASTFSAITVVLAWAFLRERMKPLQWLGAGMVVLGVAALSGGG